jgi:phospholipase/carboxylesterase
MRPHTEIVPSPTGLIYRVRRGQPHDALIVMLHGLSGDENAMWIFDHALPRSATVIAPRALYASQFGGYSWARSMVRDDLDDVDYQAALEGLSPLMAETIALYQIDPQRVIVMGFSQGAALSYAYSLRYPESLRGVIALAGFLSADTSAGTQTTSGAHTVLPHYLILHGTHDDAVPIDRAREARSALEARGAMVEYHEHRVGHKVSAQGMKEIARWIKQILA